MQVLQVGCGALGALIAQATLAQGHALTVVRRSAASVPAGARLLQADVVSGEGVSVLADQQPALLLYCLAPAERSDHAYRQTYAQGLRTVLATVDCSRLRHVFFVSSTRVYGDNDGGWVNDETLARPADAAGAALLEAEQVLGSLACGHTALRVSGIYGPERRYLLRMAQTPALWPSQQSWTNRIHEQDIVGALMHFYRQVEAGVVLPAHCILSDGAPVLQHEVLQWIARYMDWPLPPSPVAVLQTGKRLQNQRLQASGYGVQFANYQAGYLPLLQAVKAGSMSVSA